MSQVTVISECFLGPKSEVKHSEKYFYLNPLAFTPLTIGNSQYGLLFTVKSLSNSYFFNKLKESVSEALVYFYPLAGRLVTQKYQEDHECSIFVECTNGPGARLIHASAFGLTVTDVTDLDKDVPVVIQSFFDLGERQVNHDGHTRPLLSLQMTQLDDGVFIGCCINHCLADANSVSQFLNVLSQIFTTAENISRLPVFQPVFQPIKLPYLEPDEFVNRFNEGQLTDRIFHFSRKSMMSLKAKANTEANKDTNIMLSSFKALCGHLWMSIIRSRKAEYCEETTFSMTVDIRSRLKPPLSRDLFASLVVRARVNVKVGELLTNGLGWATMKIHQKVEEVSDDKVIHENYFVKSPTVVNHESLGANTVATGGSPWLDLCGSGFGLGKPVAVRTGYTNRFNGKVVAFPGLHGSGSVEIQVSLLPESMGELLLDEEFMKYVSFSS